MNYAELAIEYGEQFVNVISTYPQYSDDIIKIVDTYGDDILRAIDNSANADDIIALVSEFGDDGVKIVTSCGEDTIKYLAERHSTSLMKVNIKENPYGEKGRTLGELDGVDFANKIIYEDKTATKLYMKDPDVPMSEELWAEEKIYEKTVKKIRALKTENISFYGANTSVNIPVTTADVTGIKKLTFRVVETNPKLKNAVNQKIAKLTAEFPDYEFSAIFG